jgi:hypothetical protein
MLTVRKAQVEALVQVPAAEFAATVVSYLHRFFPEDCAALRLPELRGLVEQGISRAVGYGIASRADVCAFVGVMFTFGPAFDSRLEWARAILEDPKISSGASRLRLLAGEALARAKAGEGEGCRTPRDRSSEVA